jgi:hypothetical protein
VVLSVKRRPLLQDAGSLNWLCNRFVREATWEGMADDVRAPTQKLVKTISYFCV